MRISDGSSDVCSSDLLGAVQADLVDAEIGVRAIAQADRRRGPADLLHRHAMLEVAHAGAAVFLADCDAEHAEAAELAPEVVREGVVAVDVRGPRRDLGRREADRKSTRLNYRH